MVKRLLIAILAATGCARLEAATADFNALAVGTVYTAPALFSNGGLDFDVLFGQNLRVSPSVGLINPAFAGNYLNLASGVGLNVNLPTGASQIKFDFIQDNPGVAFVINGGWLNNDQIPTTIKGVTVTQALGSTTSPWGSLTASGAINSFIIIGTEYSIDNLNATLVAGLSGDYNKNHVVDAGDYTLWRKTLNSPSGYRSWRSNFGAVGGIGTSAEIASVPEPSTLALLLAGLQLATPRRRHGRPSHSTR